MNDNVNDDGAKKAGEEKECEEVDAIKSRDQLRDFLLVLRDRISEGAAPPLYSLSAMNHLMNLASINQLLDGETKELARDIWLRLKQAGLHLKDPPLLFGD